MSIAQRLAFSPELRDTAKWPAPAQVPEEKRAAYDRRKDAIQAYLGGKGFEAIEEEFGLPKSEIYRLLKRCLETRPDRSITGFFGIVPGAQVKPYARAERVKATSVSGKGGYAGAFLQLVSEHPKLHRFLEDQARQHAGKPPARIARQIKTAFLAKCAGYRAPNEYPFIVSDQGGRALRQYLEKLRNEQMAAAAAGAGPLEDRGDAPKTGQPSGAAALRPYEEVELDGHKGDFYFVIKMPGLGGEWIYTLPLRIWLVLMIDRRSRAILGYAYRLGGTNYSTADVLSCIAHSLTPWVPKDITLPNWGYKDGAGFPSSCTPLGAGRLFDSLHADNAWANTARDVNAALTRAIGATINIGRAGEPTARPFVERLNKTLEDRGFRKLPTGFQANSKEDRDRAFKAASSYPVTIEELEQVLDVMIANYNRDNHGALTNRSPLEFLRQWDASTESPLRVCREVSQLLERISRIEDFATIHGGKGRRPFFRFRDAEYTSTRLKQLKSSVGSKVRVVASLLGDARFVRAYLQIDDREIDLGIATAMPPFHLTPLTLAQRTVVARERRSGRLEHVPGTDAGGAFIQKRQQKAEQKKGNANSLARFGKLPGRQTKGKVRDLTAKKRVPAKDWIKI